MDNQETQAASSPANPLESLTSEQRGTWLQTGELPEPKAGEKPASGESASPDTPKEAATPVPQSETSPPVAEAGRAQETPAEKKGKSGAEKRILELLAKNKELEERLGKLPPAEAPKAVVPEATAGSQADPIPTEEDTNLDGTGKYADYPAFIRALVQWENREAARVQTKATEKAQQEKQGKEIAEDWTKRANEAAKEYPDFQAVAFAPDLDIPQGSMADAFVVGRPLGAKVLYHLGQHREELARISELKDRFGRPDLVAQVCALRDIEISLSPNGSTPPARKVTSAPRPAANLGTGSTVPEDEAAAALKEGNFERFFNAKNAAEGIPLRR